MPRETVFFYPYKIRLADSLVFILDLHAGDGAFVRVLSYRRRKR